MFALAINCICMHLHAFMRIHKFVAYMRLHSSTSICMKLQIVCMQFSVHAIKFLLHSNAFYCMYYAFYCMYESDQITALHPLGLLPMPPPSPLAHASGLLLASAIITHAHRRRSALAAAPTG